MAVVDDKIKYIKLWAAAKHVGVLTVYKILFVCIYIYICVCVCVCVCLHNKLYKVHGTYIKIKKKKIIIHFVTEQNFIYD